MSQNTPHRDSEEDRIAMLNKLFNLYDRKIAFSTNQLRQSINGKMATPISYIKQSYEKFGDQTTKPNLSQKEFIDILAEIKERQAKKLKKTHTKNMNQFMNTVKADSEHAKELNKASILKTINGVPYQSFRMNIYNQ